MNLHFCYVCQEIRDTAEGFCVMCQTFLGPTPPEQPTDAATDRKPGIAIRYVEQFDIVTHQRVRHFHGEDPDA